MVEDLKLMCERLRGMELATCNEAADLIKRQAEDIAENDAIIDELRDHLTALESERDALLAAAGKEAVKCEPCAFCAAPNTCKELGICYREKYAQTNTAASVYQIAFIGDNQWRDVSQTEFVASQKTVGAADMLFRIVYTAPTAALEKGDGRDAWISVDDRMPDEDSVVLVSAWEYGKPDGKRFTLVARRSGSLFLNEETGDDLYTPTHWMPLPAAPAAANDKEKQS
jgi:hypothetical protein